MSRSSRVCGGEEADDTSWIPSSSTDGTAVDPSFGELHQSLRETKDGSDYRASEGPCMNYDKSGDVEPSSDDDELAEDQAAEKRLAITVEEWIQRFDELHPVPDTDADLKNFEELTRKLITRLCDEARSGNLTDWYKLLEVEREMSPAMKKVLLKHDAEKISDYILRHIPRKTKQILGKRDLQPYDLLSLPEFPADCPYSIVYFDIAVQVGIANIELQKSRLVSGRTHKLVKACSIYNPLMITKPYIGSSSDSRGGWARIRQHELESNKSEGTQSKHYDFTRRPDVVTNFRIGGLFTHPSMLDETLDKDSRDLMSIIAELWEGVLIVYQGMYHISHFNPNSEHLQLRTRASYELVERLRSGLPLPDFHESTLNVGWPILQALPKTVWGKCTNETCENKSVTVPLYFPYGRTSGVCGVCRANCYSQVSNKRRTGKSIAEKSLRRVQEQFEEQDDQTFMDVLETIQSESGISWTVLDDLLAEGGKLNPSCVNYEHILEQREKLERIGKEREEQREKLDRIFKERKVEREAERKRERQELREKLDPIFKKRKAEREEERWNRMREREAERAAEREKRERERNEELERREREEREAEREKREKKLNEERERLEKHEKKLNEEREKREKREKRESERNEKPENKRRRIFFEKELVPTRGGASAATLERRREITERAKAARARY
ncbi:unnamed protein product [Fusarium equiseti]|uniref:Uncharacterized protein n=1 Tax=Fusarium equiseti TaxID=61235 RepID=A0A8J2IJ44_FUSEQ|nr:unnamed protein product [Fusarium equiseti]